MRNKLTIVLIVVLPLTAFSQSKKKIYESLVAECAHLQQSNDSLRKVCLENSREFNRNYNNYWVQCEQLTKTAGIAESVQRNVGYKVEDHNLIISHFKLKNYEPILLMEPERIPEPPRYYSSPFSQKRIPDFPELAKAKEKATYAEKNLVLSATRDSLLKWRQLAEAFNAAIISENTLVKSKMNDLRNAEKQYFAIIQRDENERTRVTDQIFIMVAEIKKSAKKPEVPEGLEEYFFDYKQPDDYGSMTQAFDIEGVGEDMVGTPPADIRVVEPPEQEDNIIYDVVDESAEFPGGMTALKAYLDAQLKYPQTASELNIEGKVYLKFVVSKKGNISNVSVLRGVPDCPECDKEAIRVVKGMPQWTPGRINGVAVHSRYNLPVKFALPKE